MAVRLPSPAKQAPEHEQAQGPAGLVETLVPPDTAAIVDDHAATYADLRFQRILVALDGQQGGQHAREWGVHLARKHEAQLHFISVVAPMPGMLTAAGTSPLESTNSYTQLRKAEEAAAAQILAEAGDLAKARGLDAVLHQGTGKVGPEIVEAARWMGADLVIVGSHGDGAMGRFMLGSVSDAVKDHAPCSVLIARNAPPPNHVVVASDLSENAQKATRHAIQLGATFHEPTTVLHVVEPPRLHEPEHGASYYGALREAYGEMEATAKARESRHGVGVRVAFGQPATAIASIVKELDARLLVVAAGSPGGFVGWVLGSVARKLVHAVEASVLIYRPSGATESIGTRVDGPPR